jgi:hypothetical protein
MLRSSFKIYKKAVKVPKPAPHVDMNGSQYFSEPVRFMFKNSKLDEPVYCEKCSQASPAMGLGVRLLTVHTLIDMETNLPSLARLHLDVLPLSGKK